MNAIVQPLPLVEPATLATSPVPITVAHGDGIGTEIMKASLRVLEAAGARLAVEDIAIGESVYLAGNSSGIEPSAWDSLRRTKVFYKAPITTPQGGGYKSLNVTVRKSLGLFANVRPCVAYAPFVVTKHPKMDVVVVRENEEDLYAGIEHRHSDEVYQCLKLITRPGCEKIVRYAFEYALANGRKKVTCFTKDNIMKMTDGLFHKVFDEIGAEYPAIEQEHMIVDIGAARLADTPEIFDVIVMPNLYGDILSDVAAQIAGSVGLAGSSNIGAHGAMFEAIHGSAPPLAGKDVAMQIAAMSPIAVDKDDVDPSLIEKEIEIGKDQARAEGKPEAILEKIAMGKLNKFYQDQTLLNQAFVKDNAVTIAQMLQKVQAGLTVKAFHRVSIGA